MAQKALTISIIIPVYNEELHLKACLDAIARQTVEPLEVIVVDNNCTDQTVALAKQYPLVKVVAERRQGRAAARSAGFDVARGDILARLDADSVVEARWTEEILATFSEPSVAGVAGIGVNNLLPWVRTVYSTFWSRVYFMSVHAFFGVVTMWGANMALRKSVWRKVRGEVCLDDSLVHEDQDISLVMSAHGANIIQNNRLRVYTEGQNYFYWPKFAEYVLRSLRTKRHHADRLRSIKKIVWHKRLSGVIFGTVITCIFGFVSFVTWPLTALVFYLHAKRQGKDTATLHRLK